MHSDDREFVLNFCSELRNWRKELGLTQAKLARLTDTSPSWISMVEHGDILPSYSKRQRLRCVLEGLEFNRAARRRRKLGTSEG